MNKFLFSAFLYFTNTKKQSKTEALYNITFLLLTPISILILLIVLMIIPIARNLSKENVMYLSLIIGIPLFVIVYTFIKYKIKRVLNLNFIYNDKMKYFFTKITIFLYLLAFLAIVAYREIGNLLI